jgi:hypothetical protein
VPEKLGGPELDDNTASDTDRCCGCGGPMPHYVADWWVSAAGCFCSGRCAGA